MAWENAHGEMALDATSQDIEKRTGSVVHLLGRIASALGLAMEPGTGRVRVNVDAGNVAVTGTITTVTTVTNITSVNGMGSVAGATINPGQQVFASMMLPALDLRNRIVVS